MGGTIFTQIGFFITHPLKASTIDDLADLAIKLQNEVRMGPENMEDDEGSKGGALRHAAWSAMSTANSEIGEGLTRAAATAHKPGTPQIKPEGTVFKTLFEADDAVDARNNEIGFELGREHPGVSPKEMAALLLEKFQTDGGWHAVLTDDGKFVLAKFKLQSEPAKEGGGTFEKAMEVLKGLDAQFNKVAKPEEAKKPETDKDKINNKNNKK